MRSKVIKASWFMAALVVLVVLICFMYNSYQEKYNEIQTQNAMREAFYATTEMQADAEEMDDETENAIVTENEIVIGNLTIRPVTFFMVDSMEEIPNDALTSMLEAAGGLEDRFMYGYYELELVNTGEIELPFLLSDIQIAMLDSDGQIYTWLEGIYYEYSLSDRCEDADDTTVVLEPGERYKTSIIALEFDVDLTGMSYYLVYNPLGHELDPADGDLYFLPLNE